MKICIRLFTGSNYGNSSTEDLEISNAQITVGKLKDLLYLKYRIDPSLQRLTVKIAQTLVTMTNEWPLKFFYVCANSTIYLESFQCVKNEEIKLKLNKKSQTKYMDQLNRIQRLSHQPKMGIIQESPHEENEEGSKHLPSSLQIEAFIESIIAAVKSNNLPQLRELCDQYYQYDINALGKGGWNALHYAASFGYVDLVNELTRNKKCDPNIVNSEGYSALHLAAFKGHVKVVTILVSLDNIQIDINDEKIGTPLHCACKKNHFKIVSLLVHKANPK